MLYCICAALLFVSTSIAAQADTLKRNIMGLRPGMTPTEFRAKLSEGGCTRIFGGEKQPWPIPQSTNVLCEKDSTSIRGEIAPRTNQIWAIAYRFSASGSTASVLKDTCQQFTTECGNISLDQPIPLGQGDLIMVKRDAGGPSLADYTLWLASDAVVDEERRAPDPNAKAVPKF